MRPHFLEAELNQPASKRAFMDAFLSQMQVDGQAESEGEFSISVEAAMRKLRDFQLPRRGSFAAHLVACAVASGASRLTVSASQSTIDFSMDRPSLSFEDLDQLFLAPFQGRAPLFLKELAVAVNGAFGLKPVYLRVDTWDGEGSGWRLHHQNGEQALTPISSSAGNLQGCRVSLFLRPPVARGFNILNYLRPILTELRDRCAHPPLDLRLGRKQGSQAVIQEKASIAHALWRSESGQPGTGLLGKIDASLEEHHQEAFSAYLWIDPKPADVGATIVVNGISYPPPVDDFLPYRWLRAVIAAPYLEKDLSQATLREDDEISRLKVWVAEKVPSLLLLRCLSFEPLHGNSLFQFNSCLREVFKDEPYRPEPVRKWFEMVELLELARNPSEFELVRKRTRRLEEKRAQHVWRTLIRSQTRLLQKAYEAREWAEVLSGIERLVTIPDFFARATETEKEVFMTLCCLAGAGKEHPIYAGLEEKVDVLWFAPRRALMCALLGRDTSILEEARGLWKHYLSFQFALPDQVEAQEHLKRVQRNHASWKLALNDFAELFHLQREHQKSLEMRIAFLKSRPASYVHWLQVVATQTQAHGTISQWAYWRARAGLTELVDSGFQAKSLHLRLARYDNEPWIDLLKESESESLSSPKWQYLFHRATWALRASGDWETARRYLCRRLLLASLDEKGRSLTTPGSVL